MYLKKNAHAPDDRAHKEASRTTHEVEQIYPYLHPDPELSAELTFHPHGNLWVLTYLRSGERTSIGLYQSRSTATLLLHSLGYYDPRSQSTTSA